MGENQFGRRATKGIERQVDRGRFETEIGPSLQTTPSVQKGVGHAPRCCKTYRRVPHRLFGEKKVGQGFGNWTAGSPTSNLETPHPAL